MRSSRPDCPLACPTQADLDRLLSLGIDIMSIARPLGMHVAIGYIGEDGQFDPGPSGHRWFAFPEPGADDIVFWHFGSGKLASWCGRSFAFGEDIIGQAATYSFDCALNIYDTPTDWLRSGRDGVVILPRRWPAAFDHLRDCPRIAIAESLLPVYRRWMRPAQMPELFVVPQHRRAA